jgi:hypothetical protein
VPASCRFLALTLRQWRWRWHISSKRRLTFTGLHGYISHTTEFFVVKPWWFGLFVSVVRNLWAHRRGVRMSGSQGQSWSGLDQTQEFLTKVYQTLQTVISIVDCSPQACGAESCRHRPLDHTSKGKAQEVPTGSVWNQWWGWRSVCMSVTTQVSGKFHSWN